MNVDLITGPTLEPVLVADCKDHLRVLIHDDDGLISSYIITAREEVEDWTRRTIMTQTWDYYLNQFPAGNAIILPFGNLQTVTHVKYTDSDAAVTTMVVTTDYLVETNTEQHGRIVLPPDTVWPTDVLYSSKPIVIRMVCGWTTAALVPVKIKSAIKMLVAQMYEDRGENIVGMTVYENKVVERLLASERLWGSF